MKKQSLYFCALLLCTLLLAGKSALAQKDTSIWMTSLEYRVHDESVFEKNYPAVKAWWLKTDADIEFGRLANTSESGRVYSVAMFKGADNLGAFIGRRVKNQDKFNAENPAIAKENRENITGPVIRSIWIRVDSASVQEPDYNRDNYPFRKMVLISVQSDKVKDFEAGMRKQAQLDAGHGIKYNSIVFRCTDGYPANTYMVVLPDKSLLDYYKNREARKIKRDQFKSDYATLHRLANDITTTIRIDHLTMVK
jgi:hypothetical protein